MGSDLFVCSMTLMFIFNLQVFRSLWILDYGGSDYGQTDPYKW